MFKVPFRPQRAATARPSAPAIIVDVRTPEEFSQAHVPGARNLPVQELRQRYLELGDDKNVPIVVYCRSGARSALAAKMLRELAFTDVTDIGAMSNWRAYSAGIH